MSTTAPASVKPPERVLQDTLLRMMILLASTIDELRTRQPKTLLAPEAPAPAPSHYTALARQIRNDVVVLLNQTQKAATALTLALKPSAASAKKAAAAVKGADVSPVAGLDEASLLAAKAQIETISVEVIPKLLWLARKTSSEGLVWRRKAEAPLSEAAQAKAKERQAQRDALEAEVEAMGGKLMDAKLDDEGEGEGGEKDDGTERVVGAGLGATFTRSINSHIFDVLDSLGNLCNAYIDERARVAMQRASAARRGAPAETASTIGASASLTAAQARALALQETAKVWAACDEAIREMPLDNIDAIARKWRGREATMDDGWEELRNEVGEAGDEEEEDKTGAPASTAAAAAPREEDPDDPLAGMHDALSLSPEEKERARRFVPLVKLGRMLHKAVGKIGLAQPAESKEVRGATGSRPTPIDLDAIDLLAEDLASCQDDLVSALLYGDDDFGLDQDDEDDSDDDSSDLSADISSARELYVNAAILLAQAVGAHIKGETEDWNGDPLPPSATTQPQTTALKNVVMLAEEIAKLGNRLALEVGEEEEEPATPPVAAAAAAATAEP